MHRDPTQRTLLVERLLARLPSHAPGSSVRLRGSLAEQHSDAYSDIDLLWNVPDALFSTVLANLAATLNRIQPVESLRFDPDFQHSDRRRLVFVRFAELPLFWRLDLDLLADSLAGDLRYDVDNPAARGTDWSLTESALANAIAALKAERRGHHVLAMEIVLRGFHRVTVQPTAQSISALVIELATAVARCDPAVAALAQRVIALAREQVR